jgi:ubiquinone/menaquinone biosynthesis C-methylase UbiE
MTEGTLAPAATDDDPEAFAGHLFGWLNGAGAILLLDVAHRSGLLEAVAQGTGTSEEVAERAGLSERHVRELLNGLTSARVLAYEPASRRYTLPPAHAACLTGTGPLNYAPATAFLGVMARYVEPVVRTVRKGGGIAYPAYRPDFTDLMDQGMRRVYDALLVQGYVPAVAGLHDRLHAGCRVADLGCGTGHVDNLLAAAYPASTFTGYELADDALARATAEADTMELANVRFERLDVRQLPLDPPFDVIFAFDAIHDQADPAAVLARAHNALAPGGLFVMVDVYVSSHPEDNVGHPMAPWLYTASLFHCMQVSLAENGAGLGTCWGWQTAAKMLADAGFRDVTVIPTPGGDPMNAIFTGRR